MKSKKIKFVASLLLMSTMVISLVGCGGKTKDNGNDGQNKKVTISISGSTSVGPFMEAVAETYQGEHENINIEIQQVGSSAGIKDTINGTNEIGMSSRELKPEESKDIKGTIICYDGIALIVNKKNTAIKDITMEQIKEIYTGKITNWKELGGQDAEIVVVSREDGSGTRQAFEELVGYKPEELVKSAQIADGNGNIKTIVEGNKNAIGFVSFEYLDDKTNTLTLDSVVANADNVKNGSYKISRPFILTTKEGNITKEGQALIDFILSEEGQKIVNKKGLITLK